MNFILLFPFSYFYTTRLKEGSLAFHVIFEWLAAALLVTCVGTTDATHDLIKAALSYLAFISVYELGYMANDLHAARKEVDGRHRGPQKATQTWIALWVLSRVGAFLLSTILLEQWRNPGWWLFFVALGIVFTLHNWLDDRELKVSTFAWLAWFRLMAPMFFVVQDSQRMGIGLAAALGYVAFRQLGYMDSKSLLKMPGRQRPTFRRFFFLMPIAGVVALFPYKESYGFVILCCYWGAMATVGALFVQQQAKN